MGRVHGESHSDDQITMYKVLAAAALFAVVAADKVPVAYAPAPAYHKPAPYVEGTIPTQPFAYEYGVADDYSKANFKKSETQDGNGVVSGSYVIALPDDRIQTTTYTADHVNGFVADVTYEGTPVYPPEPKEGYGHAAPAYAPAPAYKPAA